MSKQAWTYILGVLIGGLGFSLFAFASPQQSVPYWSAFVILTALATVAQLFEASHGNQSYYPHFVFFFAGVLLLPPSLFVLLVFIPHLIEWGKARLSKSTHLRNWYIQPFNIAVHILAGSAAYWTYNSVEANTATFQPLSPILASIAAVFVYVGMNHLLVGQALVLARGISWKQSGVLEMSSLLPDVVMSFLGYVVAVLWALNPWLTLPALSPLVLMYQALMVPQLKQEAQTDGKTGLWNARHFATLYTAEMDRAKRFDRPLSILMADLDLLRNINNTYGHIAGDVVLSGIGKIIRDNVREYDIAGRFGGEEFAIALPETDVDAAQQVAERVRLAVEAASFTISTSTKPIQVTMSIGIATFPKDALASNDLIHEADVAVYQAKLNGRNCVIAASDVPHFVKLGTPSVADRLTSPLVPSFIPRPEFATGISMPDPDAEIQAAEGATPDVTAQPLQAESPVPFVLPAVAISHTPTSDVVPAAQPPPATSAPAKIAGVANSNTSMDGASVPRSISAALIHVFVGAVIVAGVVVTGLGIVLDTNRPNFAIIGLLTALAIAVELLQINVYGENTVSVSVAIAFSAALISGVTGVAVVSAAIALAHYLQMRPALYKTAFNWATHLLAGSAPVLALSLVGLTLKVENLLALIIPIAIAALAYYVLETALIAIAISLSKGVDLLGTWREQFGWLVNHYMVLCAMGLFLGVAYTALGALGVLVFSMPVLMMRYSQKQYVERTQDGVRALKRLNEQLTLANREVVAASKTMKSLNEELFLTLSKLIDARDPYVGGHAAKVSDYAIAIAREMDLPSVRMEPLRQAGFLHDIGKIGISEQVLHKPAKLTPEEYEYVKTHAALGGEFLEMCHGLRHLAPFVRHHHERWDGTGYPDALTAEDIPLEARILAVCDAAEAMASDRPYRMGMSVPEMLAEVQRCSGTQFDPGVVEAFTRVVEREKDHLVVNSAHEVLRKQLDASFLTTGPVGVKADSYAHAS